MLCTKNEVCPPKFERLEVEINRPIERRQLNLASFARAHGRGGGARPLSRPLHAPVSIWFAEVTAMHENKKM